ncbi:MAG: bifunctional UDP-N-acetylglucosamine diphosphorylase/glucosamine-1-phosphate N-acetyltransferase GlmU [Deltaproteobacteria bacterium]|nr:bifunctional UDP-N-acetylglucosamine diphosphorylase/glucosamine-1-phosphate N-acetyltransferase GlmU [Deltaproteobacteria bacterium]
MKTAAVILAAGQGTRMKSALPKVLHQAAGLPLVAYPIRAARALNCDPVVVVVGHGADAVTAAARASWPQVRTALQKEQRGTADAVRCALGELGDADRVLILYGDCPLFTAATLGRLIARVEKARAALGVITAVMPDPTGYGRMVRNAAGLVVGIVEHKDCTDAQRTIREVNSGIYLVDRAFLVDALTRVGTGNSQREFYLTDIIRMAADKGAVADLPVPAEEMAGVNNRADLAGAEGVLWERNRRAALEAGASLRDPPSTFIESTVTVEGDVTLGHGVMLGGNTVVRAGARVDGPSVIIDSDVAAGAHVKSFSHLEGARVGARALVGPYARLRPEAVLEEEVHVGNFVEVKKATLRRGAKANHLSYLGDATVGEKSNVGAGTITCNYDGYGKYLTDIGRDVFIGSDSVLVAPLKIGDGAYVAAGSVVTDDVPANALALGRGRQVNKDGRAEQVRAEAKQRAGRK